MKSKAKASVKKSVSSKKAKPTHRAPVSESVSTQPAAPTRGHGVMWATVGVAALGLGLFAAKKVLGAKTAEVTAKGSPPLFMKIRTVIQKFAKQPDLIHVHLENDIATLEGPVQLSELEKIVAAVEAIPGLSRVVNALKAHEAPNTSKFHS